MNHRSIFERIVLILMAVSLLLINIFQYREVYVGDFIKDSTIYYPPPFKTCSKIYVYNVADNRIDTTEFIGLILGLSKSISENEVVVIKSYGLDIYVLIISLIIVAIYFKLVRLYISRTRLYVLNTVLLFTAIILIYVYAQLVTIPVRYSIINELVETIDCKNVPGLILNLCLVDSFNTYTIIYFKANSDVLLEIFKENVVIHRDLIKSNVDFLKTIENSAEYRLVILSSTSSINITYRRISFIDTRDYLLTIAVSYLPILVILAVIVINKLIHIRK